MRTSLLVVCLAGAPAVALAQGLFKRAEPLDITITTGLGALLKDRDSTDRVLHGAELAYKDSTGQVVKVAVSLRTRGHFRRQTRNCDFPPLRVEVSKAAATNTLFEGNRKLKLTTNCRAGSSDYEQYILQEYAVYRMFQALTPWSYRTRLAHVAYVDSAGKAKPSQSWAFFVEDDGDLADRRRTKKVETKGAYFDDLESGQFGRVQLFQWMVGNTDWSVSGLHNITLLSDSSHIVHPVPFDFDWSGAVNTRYSFPDKSLPIRTVTDRLWRGDCREAAAHELVFTQFKARRAAMDSAITDIAALKPGVRDRMLRYLGEAWSDMDKPARLADAFKRDCRDRN